MANKKKTDSQPKTAAPKTAAEKLVIVERERGGKIRFVIDGYTPSKKRIRKQFKTREDAEAHLVVHQVSVTNETSNLYSVTTRLTSDQVQEAESAWQMLGGRYPLTQAVGYFLAHYAAPASAVGMFFAIGEFLDAREKSGVRDRSLYQLKASLEAFASWLVLKRWPDDLKYLLPLAEAEAAGRHPRAMVKALRGLCETFPEPDISAGGEVEVASYLEGLKGRDGNTPAEPKTRNNVRADLHAFFAWCGNKARRWVAGNPAAAVDKMKEARGLPCILSVKKANELMQGVAAYQGGVMVPWFALALFGGLRTGPSGELERLARHPDFKKLLDLKRGVIHIQPDIAKTRHYRQVMIRPNLKAWLVKYPGPILAPNWQRLSKDLRGRYGLAHDVLRHTWFSMHIGAFKSVGAAAIEGGNTETILKRHYLNLASYKEAADFWKIAPAKVPGEKSAGKPVSKKRVVK